MSSRTDIKERRAIIKARFSMTDARKMCTARPIPNGALYLCPCCGGAQTSGTKTRHGRGFEVTNLRCKSCGFDGDAVAYVIAAKGLSCVPAALDEIEDYLDAEAQL